MPDRERSETHELKLRIRKEIREWKAALLTEGGYFDAAGSRITEHILRSAQYTAAKSVFIYVSTEGEPDTYVLIRAALQDNKAVYVPKCVSKETMLAVRIFSPDELQPGMMNIPEPVLTDSSVTASCRDLDLAVVPCVSVSRDRIRLGHGAGFYDRFLSAKKDGPFEKPVTLCTCFEKLLRDDIPAGPFDIPMDLVVTENGIF
ncbi:MAG: 5-formyltetrahydrofolate cyclo-ligase [Lachnospiraceae bacterium]|nr:5-formyltetrahydrofolate cyclo-ligase [Lachnospiraceae bacterium]